MATLLSASLGEHERALDALERIAASLVVNARLSWRSFCYQYRPSNHVDDER